jgi:cell division protein FtsX
VSVYFKRQATSRDRARVLDQVRSITGVKAADSVDSAAVLGKLSKVLGSQNSQVQIDPELVPQILELRVRKSDLGTVTQQLKNFSAIHKIDAKESKFQLLGKVISKLQTGTLFIISILSLTFFALWLVHFRGSSSYHHQVRRSLQAWGAAKRLQTLPTTIEGAFEGLVAGLLCFAVLIGCQGFISQSLQAFVSLFGLGRDVVGFSRSGILNGFGLALALGGMAVFTGAFFGWAFSLKKASN